MSQPPVRVVSLKRASARRGEFAAQPELRGVHFEFFDAFDGRAATAEEIASRQDEARCLRNKGRPLAPSEVACAHSHRTLYAECLDHSYDGMLVLEDDAQLLPGFPDVLAGLGAVAGQWAEEPVVFLLGGFKGFEHLTLVLGERTAWSISAHHRLKRAVVSHNALLGTYSYYITAAACASILEAESKVCNVADAWDFWLRNGVLSSVWVLDPLVVRHPVDPGGSEIQRDRHLLDMLQESGSLRSALAVRIQRLNMRLRALLGRWTLYPILKRFG